MELHVKYYTIQMSQSRKLSVFLFSSLTVSRVGGIDISVHKH